MNYIIEILKRINISIKNLLRRNWKRVKNFIVYDIRKVFSNFEKHDGELSTCAMAFFVLISFIPASLVIISILSFFYNSESMAVFYIKQIKSQLPDINIDDLIKTIDNIVYKKRYIAFIWIPFLFWWGSLVFDITERILEKAFRIKKSRIYWKAKIRHILIILSIGFLTLGFIFLSNAVSLLRHNQITDQIQENIKNIFLVKIVLEYFSKTPLILRSATSIISNSVLLFILYRFIPPKKILNSSIFSGALFAAVIYEIVKTAFSYYITEINDYTSIFGSLSSVVMLMIWIWWTCFIFVLGAELAWIFYVRHEKADPLDFSE